MNEKIFDMLVELKCTLANLYDDKIITYKVYMNLYNEVQKILNEVDNKKSNCNIDIEKYNTYIESHEIKGRGSCKTFKYNLDTILREYQTIISKMNYVPKITQIREEYEVNELKYDLINNTNKFNKLIKGDKTDVL